MPIVKKRLKKQVTRVNVNMKKLLLKYKPSQKMREETQEYLLLRWAKMVMIEVQK